MKNWCKIISTEDHDVLIYKDSIDVTVMKLRIDDYMVSMPKFKNQEERDAVFEILGTEDESPNVRQWIIDNVTELENGAN